MEWLPYNLSQVRSMSESDIRLLLQQLLEALTLLHSARITHRDIKPSNILVRSKKPLSVNLADFSLGNDRSFQYTFCGSNMYVAPEVVENAIYTEAIDIWSLGVVALQYCRNWAEWPTEMQNGRGKIKGNIDWHHDLADIAAKTRCSGVLSKLLRRMLQVEPGSRASAEACLTVLTGEWTSTEVSRKGRRLFCEIIRGLSPGEIQRISFLEPGNVDGEEAKADKYHKDSPLTADKPLSGISNIDAKDSI